MTCTDDAVSIRTSSASLKNSLFVGREKVFVTKCFHACPDSLVSWTVQRLEQVFYGSRALKFRHNLKILITRSETQLFSCALITKSISAKQLICSGSDFLGCLYSFHTCLNVCRRSGGSYFNAEDHKL